MSVTLPPYAGLLGIVLEPTESVIDPPVLRMEFTEGLAGRPGNLHGGAIAGLLDMVAHAALVHALTQSGKVPRFKPIGITIDYVRGGKHRPTFARGRVTKVGSRVATVMVEAWQEEGKQIAAARLHMLLAKTDD
jgi:uncharacterized protein (TIGR00369 family)